jgi:hypothetical protein
VSAALVALVCLALVPAAFYLSARRGEDTGDRGAVASVFFFVGAVILALGARDLSSFAASLVVLGLLSGVLFLLSGAAVSLGEREPPREAARGPWIPVSVGLLCDPNWEAGRVEVRDGVALWVSADGETYVLDSSDEARAEADRRNQADPLDRPGR